MSESQVENRNAETSPAVRIYNFLTILLDFIILHIKWTYLTIESIYRIIVPQPEKDVRSEIVLITGTAHGIGRMLAYKYGSLGAKVVCLDINENGNNETVAEIKAQGGKAWGYVCNVAKRESIVSVAEKVKSEVGIVSILVNNAGIMPTHPLLEHTEAEIRAIYDINVLAHFWFLQSFLPDMIERNHGHIVALSSCAGLFPVVNLVPYCASKFAVRGLMATLGEELRVDPRNLQIKLTTIYPYMVDTGLCKRPHTRFPILMRLVKPEEAAEAIVSAQRRDIEDTTIPQHFWYLEKISRLFPKAVGNLINDFCDTGVHSDL